MSNREVRMTAERAEWMRDHVMVQVGAGPMMASYILTTREVENWLTNLRMALVGETNVVKRPLCRKCERDCSLCNCAENVIR